MWVTTSQVVEAIKLPSVLVPLNSFTHNLSHKLKGLISPLTWGYSGFPQINGLVTTTTYNYLRAPVRFPLINFFYCSIIKRKTCKVLLQREG